MFITPLLLYFYCYLLLFVLFWVTTQTKIEPWSFHLYISFSHSYFLLDIQKKTNISIEWIRWNDQFILVILRKFIIKTKDKTLIHQKRNSQYIYLYISGFNLQRNEQKTNTYNEDKLIADHKFIYIQKKMEKKNYQKQLFCQYVWYCCFCRQYNVHCYILLYIYELCIYIYITNFKRNMYLIKTFQINSIQEDNKSLSFKKNDIFHLNSFVKCCVCYFFSFSKANLSICWCFTFAYNCIY